MNLEIRREDCVGAILLALDGELDVYTSPAFKEKIIETINEAKEVKIILDLCDVRFIDASGLGALVSGLRRVKERGLFMSLVINTEVITKIFRITGLHKIFSIHPTREAALAATGAG